MFQAYFESTHPGRWDDFIFEIKHFRAKQLIEMTTSASTIKKAGTRRFNTGLEMLVSTSSNFHAPDPRDTIYAFRNISEESMSPDSTAAKGAPSIDYSKDLFEIYRDFVEWAIETSSSLDILCRPWALPELKNPTLAYPRLVTLPSWIRLIQDPTEGKYDDKLDHRQVNTSFVGLPGNCNYDASGYDSSYVKPTVHFPKLGRIRGGTSLGPVELLSPNTTCP
jgi:hypothetical protein